MSIHQKLSIYSIISCCCSVDSSHQFGQSSLTPSDQWAIFGQKSCAFFTWKICYCARCSVQPDIITIIMVINMANTHTHRDRGSSWHSVPWYMRITTTTASKCAQWLTLPARVKKKLYTHFCTGVGGDSSWTGQWKDANLQKSALIPSTKHIDMVTLNTEPKCTVSIWCTEKGEMS